MPEGLEAEIWRSALQATVGRRVEAVWVDERVADAGLVHELIDQQVVAVRRCGKVVVLDTSGPSVGLHFGMTGRIVVDGVAPIEQLEYASKRDRPEWDRLVVSTTPPGRAGVPALRMNDPRRLGRITIDPDLDHLGVDIFAVERDSVARALSGRRLAIKTALLDQRVIAGLGNLCADEVLWWAGIAPSRPVDTLAPSEVTALTTAIRRRLPIMLRRGGSTHGTLGPDLRSGPAPCPRDGAALRRDVVGGRTAVWCPAHQH